MDDVTLTGDHPKGWENERLADYSYPHSYPLKPVPSTREEHDEQLTI